MPTIISSTSRVMRVIATLHQVLLILSREAYSLEARWLDNITLKIITIMELEEDLDSKQHLESHHLEQDDQTAPVVQAHSMNGTTIISTQPWP